jgi:tetratricopeptide (TPR) repeat protein
MEQAIKYFDKALAIEPNNADVLAKKGRVFLRQRNTMRL